MTTEPTKLIRVGSPLEMLQVIPPMLGFVPDASFVLIGMDGPRNRVRLTVRYDLPDPADEEQTRQLVGHAIEMLTANRLGTAVAAGYGPATLVDPVAGRFLAEARDRGISVYEFLRVEDGRYWSYMCDDECCCPAAGVPFTLATDPSVLVDRDKFAAQLAPVGGEEETREAERLLAGLTKADRAAAVTLMIDMVKGVLADGQATAQVMAMVTVALRNLRVRDDAWARMDPARAAVNQQVWTDVVRYAQPGYVAAPASLLAFVAWQSGNGALANVALDRALADDPDYSMAHLLRQVIAAGTPPSMARVPMTPEEVAASYEPEAS